MNHQEILDTYKQQQGTYEEFGNGLVALLVELLQKSGLHIHTLTGRLKDPSSLKAKLLAKEKYTSLTQITDLIGVRIITYFENELDYLCQLIEEYFAIDRENSIDKTKMDVNHFGYRSIHYIVAGTLGGDTELDDEKFEGIKAEIQVRTILQHAWAEIEHDLGYKSREEVPDDVRRQFFRIAALLEIADSEFAKLRTNLVQSRKKLLPQHILDLPDSTTLNAQSLTQFLMASSVAIQLDKQIADVTGGLLHYNPDAVERNLRQLELLGIPTTAELEGALRKHSGEIVALYKTKNEKWLRHLKAFPEKHGNESFPRGVCITYLCFLLQ